MNKDKFNLKLLSGFNSISFFYYISISGKALSIKLLLSAVFILLIFSIAGCIGSKTGNNEELILNAAIRFTPIVNIEVINKYGDSSETSLCEIVFSKTSDMLSPFKRLRLDKNTHFSINEFKAGDEFYIGAFIDANGNLEPDYGREPVGGAYADIALSMCEPPEVNYMNKNRISKYKINVNKDIPTVTELKMLRPITGRKPGAGAMGLTTKPSFEWTELKKINKYKITVYNEETAGAYWQAVSYSNKITYSILNPDGGYNLIEAKLLPASARHKWSLTGYDAYNELWAYATGISFLP